MYNLPKLKISSPKFKKEEKKETKQSKIFFRQRFFGFFVIVFFFSSFFSGFVGGFIYLKYFDNNSAISENRLKIFSPIEKVIEKETIKETVKEYLPQTSSEEKVINTVKKVSPSVVSIAVYKEVPVMQQYFNGSFGIQFPTSETKREKVGGGTGFIISNDGMVLTNKHVVADENAEYVIITNDNREFSSKVLAKDPLQDLAIIKAVDGNGLLGENIDPVKLGDSASIQNGQTVIAIGNALGEFQNTVSVGVVSGLNRTIIAASEGGLAEIIEEVIQTDAAISRGNSGGPLLNLEGEVIGMNTAISIQGENIGFAIPINKAKKAIAQVKEQGEIVYPYLGVRYVLVNDNIKKENNLPVNYGALIVFEEQEGVAIVEGSAAEKAGIKENDIILEFGGERISDLNPLAKAVNKYDPGDVVNLRIMRNGSIISFDVVLEKRGE